MHDIVDLERRGTPSLVVASSEFVGAVEAQARSLGLAVRRAFVAHPIQDRTDEEVRALADGALEEILAGLGR